MSKVKEGDRVLFYIEKDKYFIVKVERGKEFSFHKGKISFDDVIGREYGSYLFTSKGVKVTIFQPTIADIVMKVRRRTQIIYPKDLAVMIFKSGVGSGSRVIEIGCGSGSLTIALASAVRPDGKVYSYDVREDFLSLARSNLREVGLEEFVEFKVRDVKEGFDERDVDAVFLDLPEPWEGVKPAKEALKNGGILVSLSPTFNQLERTAVEMRRENFDFIESFEVLVRTLLPREGKTRPFERMVSHTGFIIMGRKTAGND